MCVNERERERESITPKEITAAVNNFGLISPFIPTKSTLAFIAAHALIKFTLNTSPSVLAASFSTSVKCNGKIYKFNGKICECNCKI